MRNTFLAAFTFALLAGCATQPTNQQTTQTNREVIVRPGTSQPIEDLVKVLKVGDYTKFVQITDEAPNIEATVVWEVLEKSADAMKIGYWAKYKVDDVPESQIEEALKDYARKTFDGEEYVYAGIAILNPQGRATRTEDADGAVNLFEPHDCTFVLGMCEYSITDFQSTTHYVAEATFQDGKWQTKVRVNRKKSPLAGTAVVSQSEVSLDVDGFFLDSLRVDQGVTSFYQRIF